MHGWHRALLGALLVGAVAVAGIALNFTLLRLTQDAHDPVGKLSPRAVFSRTATVPATTTGTQDEGRVSTIPGTPLPADGDRDRDD
jgi:hypothetical protein